MLVDRIIPADELGPGALECGAANYIDVQMADYLAFRAKKVIIRVSNRVCMTENLGNRIRSNQAIHVMNTI